MYGDSVEVLRDLLNIIENYKVKKIFVGAFTTMVVTRHVGLSSSLRDFCAERENRGIKDAGSLIGRDVKEIAEYVFSDNLIEASLGMASINSALDFSSVEFTEINAYEVLKEKGKNKKVAIIGHFPFVDKLRKYAKELFVFEKRLRRGDIPDTQIPVLLPEADIVAISGTVLINHTFNDVMKYISTSSYKIMLGPSTPLSKIMFDYGIDLLAGVIVVDENELFKGLSQGSSFKDLKGKKFVTMYKRL
ncbi:MAG: hypothetical protein DRI36_02745 [Caldiserica bacterium]|nr:MAG: hypothetical protein DRI36_02745 [Caldisericota bacterium]